MNEEQYTSVVEDMRLPVPPIPLPRATALVPHRPSRSDVTACNFT